MYVCTSCLETDEREFQHCPTCGSPARAKLNRQNVLIEIPAAAGMPCQICLQTGHDLKFRRFRRVISYIFAASLQDVAGYFCPGCRTKTFLVRQGTTLLTGWWGLLSLFLYNPAAILLNFYGLFAAPLQAVELGAIDLDDVRAAAAEEADFEELYSSLPTWLTSLSEEEVELVLAPVDYYAALEIARDASEEEIKVAYRRQAKRYHPDTASQELDSELLVEVIAANRVLSDPRLRYAYDHAGEHLSHLADQSANEPRAYDPEVARWTLECRYCGSQVEDLVTGVAHLERFHPEVDVIDPRSAFVRAEEPA